MRDLIFVSMEDWDEVWRRNQFLCTTLARRFPAMKILFAGLPRDFSNRLRRGTLDGLGGPTTWTVPDFPNITVTRALKLAPDSLPLGRWLNQRMARRHLARESRRLGFRQPLLWLNPHHGVHFAGQLGDHAVIYDITDDWALMPSLPAHEKAQIAAQDRELCARADLVVVCSAALEKSRRGRCRRLLLLPNGVDADHYTRATQPPPGGRRWPAPVFGYTGTIHPDRVDFAIVRNLARAFPAGRVVLVGFDHSDRAKEALGSEPNVELLGQIPYARIPETMAEFDVCIVPHVETPFTESLNPIKLWEYLAAGKPIVSTNVAGFRDFPQLCRTASGAEPFIAACQEALLENGALRTARLALAREHTWEARVDALLETMRQAGIIAA